MINIDYKDQITLKIIDYGLSTKLNFFKKVETFDALYFPPEIIKAAENKKNYLKANKRMDVYMMGLAMLQMFVDRNNQNFLYDKNKTRLRSYFEENKSNLTKEENGIINLLLDKAIVEFPKNRLSASKLVIKIKQIMGKIEKKEKQNYSLSKACTKAKSFFTA